MDDSDEDGKTKCMRLYDLTFAWIIVFVCSCIICSSDNDAARCLDTERGAVS